MMGQIVKEYRHINARDLHLCVDEMSREISVGHAYSNDKGTMEFAVMDLDGFDTDMNGPYDDSYIRIELGEYNVHIRVKMVG
jgi:hypothetical protein